MNKIIVIGGGASGMIAAGVSASKNNETHLFEKNNKLGKKLYITGKGRCNLTNATSVETILDNIPGNPYFLYSALYSFDSSATIDFFKRIGVPTKIERGNRVFPVSEKASDVIKGLEKYLTNNNVKIHLNNQITKIEINNKEVKGAIDANGVFHPCNKIIIATGGLSYPMTGSTGDGYKFAKSCGHNVTKLNPSLVGLVADEKWVSDLQGLSLKNIGVNIKINGKSVYKDFGEMLFTHCGVSGPVILSASRHLIGKFASKPKLAIDLKPALNEKELDLRLLRDFEKYINKDFINSLDDLLPQKLISVFVTHSKIPPNKKVHDITKQERKNIVTLLKNFELTIKDTAGFNEAVITSGGIDVDEIDPSTMESKIVKGLYFAGEVIDVDGYTGGFNLQIAFSTGYLAGISV